MAYDSEHGKLWQEIKADLDKTRYRASKVATDAEWAFGKRTARVLGVVTLFAVVVALLLVFLDWYIDPTKPGDKKDLILAIAQILAGTALLSGLYFTWRTLQVNREGQITERFTRAIDQLGNDTPAVRIGGIYALERIARESEHHYWPIVEVLTSYVRTRGSQEPVKPNKDRTHQHRSADVQAALYVLANRNHALDPGDKFINLSGTDLRNADMRKAHLEKARLRETNLTGATLRDTNFQSAKLKGAKLNEAELHPSNFEEADLEKAQLVKADLEGAVLKGADLTGADLTGADLRGANLRDARGVTKEHLEAQAKTLKGATMPDGSKHD